MMTDWNVDHGVDEGTRRPSRGLLAGVGRGYRNGSVQMVTEADGVELSIASSTPDSEWA